MNALLLDSATQLDREIRLKERSVTDCFFLQVALHFWGSGEGALPVIALFFVREMAMKLDSEMLDACLKGMYKEFAANAKFVNPTSFPRIQFRMNCVTELYGIDSSASYQLAFVFIRQMAFILRNAITVKTKV